METTEQQESKSNGALQAIHTERTRHLDMPLHEHNRIVRPRVARPLRPWSSSETGQSGWRARIDSRTDTSLEQFRTMS
jgi:hypothetical protein